jgi:hypothetical protein
LAADDDQPFEEPAMLNRFLPLAALKDYEAVYDNNGRLISVELDSW